MRDEGMGVRLAPRPQVVAGALGGAAATIVVYIVEASTGLDIPAEVAGAAATLFAFAAAWLKGA